MLIEEVKTYPLIFNNPRPYGDANGLKHYRSCYLIQIITRSGLDGWGECADWLPTLNKGFNDRVITYLKGKDCTQQTRIVSEVKKWHSRSAAAISMALTEIQAKVSGVHVCDLWGGPLRDEVPVYASLQSYNRESDWVNHSLSLVEQASKKGFNQIKVKIGGKPFSEDLSHIETLFHHFPNIHFIIDANQSYDLSTARRWCSFFERRNNVLWFEEPLPIHLIADYGILRQLSPIPIAGGENLKNVPLFINFLQRNALDILQPDLTHLPGIEDFLRVLHLARDFGVRVSPHSFDGPLSRYYGVLAMACLLPWGKMKGENIEPVEWDVMDSPFQQLLPLSPHDGKVKIPKGKGIGVELNWDVINRYQVKI